MEICNGDYGRYLPQMVNAIENGKNNAWRSISNVTNVNHQEEVIALNVTASFQALRQRSPMEIQHVYGKHKAGAGCAIGFWKQLFILLKRNAIRLSRDKVMNNSILEWKIYLQCKYNVNKKYLHLLIFSNKVFFYQVLYFNYTVLNFCNLMKVLLTDTKINIFESN